MDGANPTQRGTALPGLQNRSPTPAGPRRLVRSLSRRAAPPEDQIEKVSVVAHHTWYRAARANQRPSLQTLIKLQITQQRPRPRLPAPRSISIRPSSPSAVSRRFQMLDTRRITQQRISFIFYGHGGAKNTTDQNKNGHREESNNEGETSTVNDELITGRVLQTCVIMIFLGGCWGEHPLEAKQQGSLRPFLLYPALTFSQHQTEDIKSQIAPDQKLPPPSSYARAPGKACLALLARPHFLRCSPQPHPPHFSDSTSLALARRMPLIK
ncbi:hypothetical protein CCH79_00001172 [Gambusia affinis]|uniref:Uncharacterized protein n=1 Tax=Gambusia affinis TaxID=33528 RepID=A0A315VTU8_GAMAF|nr:hypothetical protein CCH79_00001172 [Gambusia affinis]